MMGGLAFLTFVAMSNRYGSHLRKGDMFFEVRPRKSDDYYWGWRMR